MFSGTFRHQLDEKGRVRIPADFREELGKKLRMFYMEGSHCIMVYTESAYESIIVKRFETIDIFDKDMIKKKRKIFSRTRAGKADDQGRTLLDSELVKLAGIDQKVVCIGVMDHIEIWDEATYDEYMADADDDE